MLQLRYTPPISLMGHPISMKRLSGITNKKVFSTPDSPAGIQTLAMILPYHLYHFGLLSLMELEAEYGTKRSDQTRQYGIL